MNALIVTFNSSCLHKQGAIAKVTVKSGKVYEGVFKTFSPQVGHVWVSFIYSILSYLLNFDETFNKLKYSFLF